MIRRVVQPSRLCGALLFVPLLLGAQAPARRQLDFTTRQGTWMSPDVSRDGGTVVFDLLGDLYTVPVTGGPARAIVTGTDHASQPRVSPDGRLVLYVSDRDGSDNLWVAGIDGSNPRRVTSQPRVVMLSPAWSADGTTVLATVITGFNPFIADVWEFSLNTGDGARVIENANEPPRCWCRSRRRVRTVWLLHRMAGRCTTPRSRRGRTDRGTAR